MDYANHFDQFWKFDDNVERINAPDVNCEEFIERFEKVNKPVVIEGLQVILPISLRRNIIYKNTFLWCT